MVYDLSAACRPTCCAEERDPSSSLKERLKIESLKVFVVFHRELSGLEIKNAEVLVPFSA